MTDEGPLTDEERDVVAAEGGYDHPIAKHIAENADHVRALLRFAFRKIGEEIR